MQTISLVSADMESTWAAKLRFALPSVQCRLAAVGTQPSHFQSATETERDIFPSPLARDLCSMVLDCGLHAAGGSDND